MRRIALVVAAGTVLAAVGVLPAVARPTGSAAPTAPHAGSVGGTIPQSVVDASAAPGSTWEPEAPTYPKSVTDTDVSVPMGDGVSLSIDVTYPSTDGTTKAPGPFPVIMTMTPYGKTSGGALGGAVSYLVSRGYIDVVADVRGTGDSGGEWGLFDPVQATDGTTLVDYVSKLPQSSRKVGLYGASYLGIDQIFTAAAEPKGSPLKAIFPVVAATDVYRDTAFMGGVLDSEFDAVYLGLTGGLNTANPLVTALGDPQSASTLTPTELAHLQGIADYHAAFTAKVESNQAEAYDEDYWKARQPSAALPKIVANGIPAYLVGGEYDLFQRGEVDNYGLFQNLSAGRPSLTPITPDVSTTGRYQLLVGPWTHVVASATDYSVLQLRWFDQWLKGIDTGVADTPTPVHAWDLGTQRWTEGRSYDVGTPTRLYLGAGTGAVPLVANHGTLSPTAPTTDGTDTELWTGTGGTCSESADQWGAGLVQTGQYATGLGALPCTQDDSPQQVGPNVLTYTTAPLAKPAQIVGSSAVTVYASTTSTGVELVATLDDIAPDGTSTYLTQGALLGRYQQLDPAQSVKASDGNYIRPDHPYTTASTQTAAVKTAAAGGLTRYDFEVFPTLATIPAGHALRLTLATADAGHLTVNAVQAADLAGGAYTVSRTAAAPSALELRLVAAPGAITSPGSGTAGSAGDTTTTGSTTAGGALATTGFGIGLPIAAVLLVGAGVGLRRLRR